MKSFAEIIEALLSSVSKIHFILLVVIIGGFLSHREDIVEKVSLGLVGSLVPALSKQATNSES